MVTPRLTWSQVWQRRLTYHWLAQPAGPDRLLDVVAGMCGVHAQVMGSAEVSLGLRVDGLSREDLYIALWETRSLVKTYGLRGTVHIFPSRELGMWLGALHAKPLPRGPNAYELDALPPARRDEMFGVILRALDGRQLNRQELEVEVEQSLEVRVDPFSPLSAAQQRMVEQQAARVGEILGCPVDFAFRRVEPRAHL